MGPGPVAAHLAHARALADLLDPPGRFLDLGTGGGVPGLILAVAWPHATAVLLDRRERSGAFLDQALRDLGLAPRVRVVVAEAERAARDDRLRGHFELVVARSFGAPAVTAECAVGFLAAGGRLAVSEPPGGANDDRWPEEPLRELGLTPPQLREAEGTTVAVFRATGPPDDRWPRGPGKPAKRPLW